MGGEGKMTDEVVKLLERVTLEVSHLHFVRAEHEALFGKAQERLELLNDVSPHFFRRIQIIQQRDLIIGLSKLIAKRKTGSNKNVGLELLAFKARPNFPDLFQEFDEIICDIANLRQSSSSINRLRSKLVAHSDFEAVLKPEMVQSIDFEMIDEVLASVGSIYNRLRRVIDNSEVLFDQSQNSETRIQTLCTYLNAGRTLLRENPTQFKKFKS